jgi:hypothetical protein
MIGLVPSARRTWSIFFANAARALSLVAKRAMPRAVFCSASKHRARKRESPASAAQSAVKFRCTRWE